LRATFPGGSITGAPKVRAMEIIDELEPVARGVYTGALGWVGAGGSLELSIVIRTAVILPDHLSLAVGGGVVADSTPARELEETEEKALAWRRLLQAPP
jgi:para-aminobenzoate synthetase component 1